MELSEYRNIFENEDKHFFYSSTHKLISGLVKKFTAGKNLSILDAGCGTGGLALKLMKLGNVVGVDMSDEALKFARKRKIKVVKASISRLPFAEGSFDVVTNIDVLGHEAVKNDVLAIAEMGRVLKNSGILIVRASAFGFLYSSHDRFVHNIRRYTRKELVDKMARAGLSLKFIGYVHSPIFLMSLVRVLIGKICRSKEHSTIGGVNPILNRVAVWILNKEADLVLSGVRLPFGQALVGVFVKEK